MALPGDLDVALAALRRGAAIVYPTETFYGLGARALDAPAVARWWPPAETRKPIALIVRDAAMLMRVARSGRRRVVMALLARSADAGPRDDLPPAHRGSG
jgi:L-threonylcarbamoyladenylate synthase